MRLSENLSLHSHPRHQEKMSTRLESFAFERLERLSSKRNEWVAVSIQERFQILQEMKDRFEHLVKSETMYEQVGRAGLSMMGVPTNTDEGELEAQFLCFLVLSLFRTTLYGLKDVYEMRVAGNLPQPSSFLFRKAINGQVCVETFPILAVSKSSLNSACKGEVWLDPQFVHSGQDFKPYQFPDRDGVEKETGLMVVLGAGNQDSLAMCDALHGLFSRNYVVYLKLHAVRNHLEAFVRSLFEPLIRRGFLEVERHTTNERAAALVNHPLVTAVHLTGGKATHDGIVWGFDPEQQEQNKKTNTPVLKAQMTSELGAVSPWIVVPAKYTKAELQSQAGMLAAMMHANASCNCNAPKIIVVADSWDQQNEFLEIVALALTDTILPVPYYPGCAQRWKNFRDHYPHAKILGSKTGTGVEERRLSKPFLSEEAILLPHLVIDLAVDLTTEAGRALASKEYAFKNEPFCPIYTIARLKHAKTLEAFCDTAATFCNDYVFGSLSGTITVKPELQATEAFQRLIANLKYGGIGVNNWGGICYGFPEGVWGAFPGESLDKVESGIGRINNLLGIAAIEKCVMTGPIVSSSHPKLEKNLKKQAKTFRAINKLMIAPGLIPVLELISAITGIDLTVAFAIVVALLAVIGGYICTICWAVNKQVAHSS